MLLVFGEEPVNQLMKLTPFSILHPDVLHLHLFICTHLFLILESELLVDRNDVDGFHSGDAVRKIAEYLDSEVKKIWV